MVNRRVITCGMQVNDCWERPVRVLGLYDSQRNPCFWRVVCLSPVFQLLHMKICTGTPFMGQLHVRRRRGNEVGFALEAAYLSLSQK